MARRGEGAHARVEGGGRLLNEAFLIYWTIESSRIIAGSRRFARNAKRRLHRESWPTTHVV
jgi:hypothetical protein